MPEHGWPASLARPAGLQLLKANRFDPNFERGGFDTEHELFFAELQALNGGRGYPARTDNVGVSFGAATPNPDTGGAWLEVDYTVPIIPTTRFFIQHDHRNLSAGSLLPTKQTEFKGYGRDGRFRVTRYRSDRFQDPTFIPYDSALDIVDGASGFLGPTLDAGSEPSYHDVIPVEVVDPLLNRLGYELPPPTSVSVTGPLFLAAGQDGTYRAVTPNPNATYTYAWEWRALRSTSDTFGGGRSSSEGYIPYGRWHTAPETGSVFATASRVAFVRRSGRRPLRTGRA